MNFNLKNKTVLLTVAGSRAYGTFTKDSDVDLKGACIPPAQYRDGFLHRFEQADKPYHMKSFYDKLLPEEKLKADEEELEGTVYEIRKFFKLAADCNPNILDVLFCRDKEVRYITPIGIELRRNANLFLSKKARWTFGGYAISQLKRIKTHRKWLLNPVLEKPERKDFDLPDDNLIPKDQLQAAEAAIKKKLDGWEIDFGDMDESSKLYIKNQIARNLSEQQITSDEKFAAAARSIGYNENLIYLLQREKEYKSALTQWKQYNHWKKTRNPERAEMEKKYGYDLKHANHLVRLYRMCKEILETGQVNVWREDADELLAIRNGAWSYDELMSFVEKEKEEVDRLYKTSTLPRSPDRDRLDQLCIKLVNMV